MIPPIDMPVSICIVLLSWTSLRYK
jgi:hypothetical protein